MQHHVLHALPRHLGKVHERTEWKEREGICLQDGLQDRHGIQQTHLPLQTEEGSMPFQFRTQHRPDRWTAEIGDKQSRHQKSRIPREILTAINEICMLRAIIN